MQSFTYFGFYRKMDLFASNMNFQVPRYSLWFPDPYGSNADAFSMSWEIMSLCFSSF